MTSLLKLSQSVSNKGYAYWHKVAGTDVSYRCSNCLPYLRTNNHVPGFKGSLSLHHMFPTDFNQLPILRKCKYKQHYCEKCTNSDLSLFIFPSTCHQHLMCSGTSEGTLYCFCALWWRAFEISMFQWRRASCSRWPCRPIPSTGFIAG